MKDLINMGIQKYQLTKNSKSNLKIRLFCSTNVQNSKQKERKFGGKIAGWELKSSCAVDIKAKLCQIMVLQLILI